MQKTTISDYKTEDYIRAATAKEAAAYKWMLREKRVGKEGAVDGAEIAPDLAGRTVYMED